MSFHSENIHCLGQCPVSSSYLAEKNEDEEKNNNSGKQALQGLIFQIMTQLSISQNLSWKIWFAC